MAVRLQRKSDQQLISTEMEIAESFVARARGWIGRRSLRPQEGLLFPRCNSIHMWFMSIPIDVVFLKRLGSEWEILRLCPSLKPWKVLPEGSWGADDTLELPEGSIHKWNLKVGEVLCIAS